MELQQSLMMAAQEDKGNCRHEDRREGLGNNGRSAAGRSTAGDANGHLLAQFAVGYDCADEVAGSVAVQDDTVSPPMTAKRATKAPRKAIALAITLCSFRSPPRCFPPQSRALFQNKC